MDRSGQEGRRDFEIDARLESDCTVVVFFHASNPNPGIAGKTGVELVAFQPIA